MNDGISIVVALFALRWQPETISSLEFSFDPRQFKVRGSLM